MASGRLEHYDFDNRHGRRDSHQASEYGIDSKKMEHFPPNRSEEPPATLHQRLKVTSKPISHCILESGLGAGLVIQVRLPPSTDYDTSPYASSTTEKGPVAADSSSRRSKIQCGTGDEHLFCMTQPGYVVRIPGIIETFCPWKERESAIPPLAKNKWPMIPVYAGSLKWVKDTKAET